MFVLHVDKNKVIFRDSNEIITSGSVNVYTVRFQFSTEWADLTRVAVFRAGADAKSILLDDTNQCTIPWEVLIKAKRTLYVGVMGTKNGEVVLPTVWAALGEIKDGTSSAEAAGPPTPSLWEQELARKQDKLTGQPGQVVGFDESGSAVPQNLSSDNGKSTTDHRDLTHREDEDAHPIEAITGLKRELSKRVEADDALSVVDIIKIMEG